MDNEHRNLTHLGHTSVNPTDYDPNLLETISRSVQRERMGLSSQAWRYFGVDVWVAHELSWLDSSDMPCVAKVRFTVPCTSTNIVESKSFKLYLQSFSHTQFKTREQLVQTIKSDLELACDSKVDVDLLDVEKVWDFKQLDEDSCLDRYQSENSARDSRQTLTKATESDRVEKWIAYTNLFRCVCPVTGQPDFATVLIECYGEPIAKEGLLTYLLSYREQPIFHESVIERIFCDLINEYDLKSLTVYGFFLRRGGVDITPVRSTSDTFVRTERSPRQ